MDFKFMNALSPMNKFKTAKPTAFLPNDIYKSIKDYVQVSKSGDAFNAMSIINEIMKSDLPGLLPLQNYLNGSGLTVDNESVRNKLANQNQLIVIGYMFGKFDVRSIDDQPVYLELTDEYAAKISGVLLGKFRKYIYFDNPGSGKEIRFSFVPQVQKRKKLMESYTDEEFMLAKASRIRSVEPGIQSLIDHKQIELIKDSLLNVQTVSNI